MTSKSTKSKFKLGILALITSLLFTSCLKNNSANPGPIQNQDIYTSLSTSGGYSILTAAIVQAGWKDSLKTGKGPYTLFAPSDADFASTYGIKSASDLAKMSADSVKALVSYHLFKSTLNLMQIPAGPDSPRTSALGLPVYFTQGTSTSGYTFVYLNGTPLYPQDYPCTNGFVLLLSGAVLNPPTSNIVGYVQKKSNLSLLNAALNRANLTSTLSGAANYTLFAPTDSAFGVAGYKTVHDINAADPAVLGKLISYHLISGRKFSSDFTDQQSVQTVNGAKVQISLGNFMEVSGQGNTSASKVILPNRSASNGVVFIIDQVLKPGN